MNNIPIEEMPREIARLEEENELLQNRIDKALSKLEEIALYDEYITIHTDFINDAKQILKGKE